MFSFFSFPATSPRYKTRAVLTVLAGAAALTVFSLQRLPRSTADATPASTLKSAGSTWQDTEFSHVQVRFEPRETQDETQRKTQSSNKRAAWIYVKPGTRRPASLGGVGVRRPSEFKTKTLPDGTTMVELGRSLLYSSSAHRDKNKRLQFNCAKNHDHNADR